MYVTRTWASIGKVGDCANSAGYIDWAHVTSFGGSRNAPPEFAPFPPICPTTPDIPRSEPQII